jgi:tetratricopeptide (TPR) repeat protein/two-component SAPR family response regulator
MRDGHKVSLKCAVEVLDRLISLNADDYLIAWAIQNRGVAYGEAGNLTGALSDIRQAKEMFEELDEKFQVGQCHQKIGAFLAGQGKTQEANYNFQQAINIWETLPNLSEMVISLNSLGGSLIAMGSYNKAVSCLSRAFDLARQIGFNKQSIVTLLSMGEAYLGLNLLDKALGAYQHAATLANEAKHHKFQILALIKVSTCFYQQGQLVEAVKLTAQAKVMAGKTEFHYERGLATMLQAKIHVTWAEYEPSFALFEEALACFVNNHTLEQIKVRLWWGYSLLLDSRSSAAFEQLRQVISLVLATQDLQQGLNHTIRETQQFLNHFLYNRKTSPGMRHGIEFLLQQEGNRVEQSKPGLQFFAFGHPTLIVGGRRKNFVQRGRSHKMPEFLAYLLFASQNGGCRWDELSAAIWPDLETYTASARFHQSLKRLRNSILGQPDYTILQDDYYQINPAYAQWCDAIIFDKLFDRIVQMPVEESLDLQLELIDLYQGEFLVGFDLEEWAQLYRIQCEARFLRIVKIASEQLLKIGLPWKALMIAKKGLAQDFFREDLHSNVLIAFAQLGLRSELERHFKTMCDTFERELITPPQYEIRELYQQLTTQV